MSNILIILSAADIWTLADGSTTESGVWGEEFVAMDKAFLKAGHTVAIATPGGVRPTIDPHSMDPKSIGQEKVDQLQIYLKSVEDRLAAPLVLADVVTSSYDAIAIPGGHGPVEDLYKDADMGRILVEAQSASKIIAPVCHGPAALLAAKDSEGKWLFAGRRMAAFTNEEEADLGTADNAPWLLGDALLEAGARYEQGPSMEPFVVRDRNLFTGQNPASSKPLADAVIAALR